MNGLGWSAGQDRNGDSTGVCHWIAVRRSPGSDIDQGFALCGAKRTSGQVHAEPPNYCPQKCKTCAKAKGGLKAEGATRKEETDGV